MCLVAVIGVLLIIVEQYLVPTIANSLIPVSTHLCHGADWVGLTVTRAIANSLIPVSTHLCQGADCGWA